MTRTTRPAGRRARCLAAVPATAAAAVLLAACGAPGGAADDTGPASSAPKASGTAIPTRDVVSGIAADPVLHAALPAPVRAAGTLSVGVPAAPGTAALPHTGRDAAGRPVGLDVDLREAVARILGITWDARTRPFPGIIPGVRDGRLDVGQADFAVTAERERTVDLTTYLNEGQAFLGSSRLGRDRITALTDLCGLTVAALPGSAFQEILTRGASGCATAGRRPYTVRYATDVASMLPGRGAGRPDVYFGPTLGVRYAAAHVPDTVFLGRFATTPVGFVTKKGSPLAGSLRDAVDELIADGSYARITAKWGASDAGLSSSRIDPAPAR